jgi:hypothetical protein
MHASDGTSSVSSASNGSCQDEEAGAMQKLPLAHLDAIQSVSQSSGFGRPGSNANAPCTATFASVTNYPPTTGYTRNIGSLYV